MSILAIVMFVLLFGFGGSYFGWNDHNGKVQLALFTTYVLGLITAYKAKG